MMKGALPASGIVAILAGFGAAPLFPLVFAVAGVNFPIGVLLYWLTTNVWSMGQQFYVIRRNPVPGSPAAEALAARKAAKVASSRVTRLALPATPGSRLPPATAGPAG